MWHIETILYCDVKEKFKSLKIFSFYLKRVLWCVNSMV